MIHQGSTTELYHSPPSEELARYLGPTNWFDEKEVTAWFDEPANAPRHHRPEELTLELNESGTCVVEQARFLGSHQEVELRHEQQTRTVWLSNSKPPLQEGARGFLKALLLLCGLLLLAGCESAEGVVLPVESTRYWMLPKDDLALPAPRGMGMSSEQNLLVLDNGGRVLVYTPEGKLIRHWYMPEYDVGKPEGIVELKDGRIAVADTHYHRVVFFDKEGNVTGMFGELGNEPGQFIYPVGITEDDDANIYVCEYGGNDRIQKFDKAGNFLLTFGTFGESSQQFQRASGLAWHNGHVYIADAINNRIQVYSDDGNYVTAWGSAEHPLELNYPYDIAVGPEDTFYVVEYGSGRVTKLDEQGHLIARYGQTGIGIGQFNTPWGLTVDRQNHIYVADTGNRRVVLLNQ
ncbi:MAG: hypothetical protein R3C11_26645 [Planctomycetaceae bacterium]